MKDLFNLNTTNNEGVGKGEETTKQVETVTPVNGIKINVQEPVKTTSIPL